MKTGIFILLCLLNGFTISAQVYKWVDENGVTHYSKNKPETEKTTQIKIKGLPGSDEQAAVTSDVIPVEVDCQKAVRHGSKLMAAEFESQGGNNSLVAALTDPTFIIETIAACQREIKDPEKATAWLCQQNASTVEEIEQCEYL